MTSSKRIEKARLLRKEITNTEKILWGELRMNKLGVKFRRQHPIDMFVIDFYCPKYKLGIEVDGNTHTNEGKQYDKIRTEYLEEKNISIIRFWNSEIENNLSNVLEKIKSKIEEAEKMLDLY